MILQLPLAAKEFLSKLLQIPLALYFQGKVGINLIYPDLQSFLLQNDLLQLHHHTYFLLFTFPLLSLLRSYHPLFIH